METTPNYSWTIPDSLENLYPVIRQTLIDIDEDLNATAGGGGGGANTALSNLASVAINESLLPSTSDAIALGSGSKMWSDLFLASGAVINFNNDDLTLTHSANLLTVDGGNLLLTGDLAASALNADELNSSGGINGMSVTAETHRVPGSSSGVVIIQAAAVAGTWALTLPTDDGTNGQVLTTDGSGVTSWQTPSAGANTALSNLAAVAINTSLLLGTSDGGALGSATKQWSDLFLAAGAVINFDNGDVTLTHSVGTLTIGSELVVDDLTVNNEASIGGAFVNTLVFNGATSGQVTILPAAVAGTWTLTLPTDDGTAGQVLTTDGAGATSWSTPTTGANTALSNLASLAINTSLLLGTSDGGALGSTTKMWSDLFLASGAVINFNNGDVTLTHSADLLALAGGSLSVSGDVTASSTLLVGVQLIPTTNNAVAIGSAGDQWADLFLGSGAVINFNAGDVTITHAANQLTFAGGECVFVETAAFENDVTIDGSLTSGGPVFATSLSFTGITSGAVTIQPAAIAGIWTLTLPTDDGTAGQVLTTDGNGVTSWTTVSGGSGANTALSNLASVAINTSLIPGTSDGAALGSTTKQWSDLYLAEGGVINWDNGDATLTQVGNVVTLAGADFVADNVTVNSALLPDANDGAALGSTSLQFSDLFLAEGGVINWDNGDATLTQSGNTVTLAGADLALTNMTAGSILFAGTSGLVSQSNAHLFWDNTAFRLKITGTAASSGFSPDLRLGYSGDSDAAFSYLAYDHDNIAMVFDAYWNGSNWTSSDAGSNFAIYKTADKLAFGFKSGVSKGSTFASFDTDNAPTVHSDGGFATGNLVSKGQGSIHGVTIWRNGTSLDYVFEDSYDLLSIDEMAAYFRKHHYLPTIPTPEVNHNGSTNMGALTDRLLETVECYAQYIAQLHERLKVLESQA